MQILSNTWFIDAIYLVSVVLFIFGLKKLGSPRTARFGNILSMTAMGIAIVATLFEKKILSYELIIIGILVGAIIGTVMAKKVKMTGMPQMVALFNGFGGAASALVAFEQYYDQLPYLQDDLFLFISLLLSVLIGVVTLSGSLIAFAKLQGIISGNAILYPLQKSLNLGMFIVLIICSINLNQNINHEQLFFIISGICFILGVTLVIPIGGADMPVVVSLLNSYSGLAVSMTGFVLGNYALVIVGSLVGASGIILTNIMCKGMNRSLSNVLFGGFGANKTKREAKAPSQSQQVKSTSSEESAMILDVAEKVVFVPGYGMAVSQAQYAVDKLANYLIDRGVEVKFAIHPVAGRMPGHMNVLLAEAGVNYELLYDMDQINDEFSSVDVSIVIGANDVVNPAAKEDKSSPIYGMPVLNVEASKSVMVLKRSMNPGFAGIENNLFYRNNTLMVFGDAKKTLEEIITSLEDL